MIPVYSGKIPQGKLPPNIGERVVVHGRPEVATVAAVKWDPVDHDWFISLDWGVYGVSRVWGRDEGPVWYRWATTN